MVTVSILIIYPVPTFDSRTLKQTSRESSLLFSKSLHLNSVPPIAIAIPWQVSTLYLILLHVSSCGFTWPSWAESSTVVLITNRTFLIEEIPIEDVKSLWNW